MFKKEKRKRKKVLFIYDANHAGDEVVVILRKVNRNFGFDGKGDEASVHFTSYITSFRIQTTDPTQKISLLKQRVI